MKGIDVSTYQGEINWQKVKSSGVDFAMIKAGQGRSERNPRMRFFMDGQFERNITNAYSWGIRCGVYYYMTAKHMSELYDEERHLLGLLSKHKDKIKLWVAIDVESEQYLPRNKALLTKMVADFCETLESHGYPACIYTNPSWMRSRLDMRKLKYPVWLALWRDKSLVPKAAQYPGLVMWQWGASLVDGITGCVDSNLMIDDRLAIPPKNPIKDPDVKEYRVGQKFTIRPNSFYTNGVKVPPRLYGKTYRILAVKHDAVLLSGIFSWVRT